VQNRFGIGSPPEAREFVRVCGERGVAFVPYFAIAGEGREAGTTGGERDEVIEVARAHGASPAQVRIAWTLRQGRHVLAIPGTGNPDHLAANLTTNLATNLAAGDLRLTDDEMARLDALPG
jgi:pyridoxine 4-dehydrogenase